MSFWLTAWKRKPLAWLGLAALLVVAYPIAFKLGSDAWFVWNLDTLAGAAAANCGHIKRGTEPSLALSCVNQSITIQRPFKVAFDLPGAGSSLSALGIAKDTQGPVRLLRYDSDPGGSCLYLCSPRIVEEPCSRLDIRAEKVAPSLPFWNIQATCEPIRP